MDPNLNPSLEPAPRVVHGNPGRSQMESPDSNLAWGTQQGATWIAASQFTVRLSSTAPTLTYAGNFFFNSPVGSGTERYYAQLQVEPGVLISHLSCDYNDSSAGENIGFTWYKYTTDFSSDTTTAETLDSFVTSGTPGVAFSLLDPGSPETMHIYDPSADDLINHYIAVDVGANTSFAGCYAFWHRQVAPAPGVATFGDVPTGHLFFQQIEAMANSGITGGCGGDNYCPSAPVTRGQMAAFLAKAFGLGFPF